MYKLLKGTSITEEMALTTDSKSLSQLSIHQERSLIL